MPSGRELREEREDVVDDDRRQPHRRLVDQHDARVRHVGTRDGEHLLLAAAQRAGDLSSRVPEHRERLDRARPDGVLSVPRRA